MLKKIESSSLGAAYHTWLQSTFHFSVADYYKPLRPRLGIIKAINDDVMHPNGGHDMHPHRHVNILTFIVKGELVHTLKGDVPQHLKTNDLYLLNAGQGVEHAEFNWSTEPVRMLQIWFTPNQLNKKIRYEALSADKYLTKNKLIPVVGPVKTKPALVIEEDLTVFVGVFNEPTVIHLAVPAGRQAYLVQLEGESECQKHLLQSYDSLEIIEEDIQLNIAPNSKILLLELKKE